jgi:hypothetical protein
VGRDEMPIASAVDGNGKRSASGSRHSACQSGEPSQHRAREAMISLTSKSAAARQLSAAP